jgi:hypothetical protein
VTFATPPPQPPISNPGQAKVGTPFRLDVPGVPGGVDLLRQRGVAAEPLVELGDGPDLGKYEFKLTAGALPATRGAVTSGSAGRSPLSDDFDP